ncbi:SigE family RNA polymerase sigma factor [Virgisporangium aurantiacum]|uniref:RNA polymerase n=1 Tax=Virgisporangium aurantiacum TaxID=175570 RepID=A0A8J3YX71_9ACTN|nr:SigE family RNA polymerase sigma factor [Virgisporangium aurantiacum]GIJ53266.1 RNA polymerase [Virgisporangium aurantiacum]
MTFDEFVAVRLTALVRYAAVLAGDRDLAQDVVQDALVRLHARWSRVEHPEAFVRRMIVREYLSWRRRLLRRRALAAQLPAAGVVVDHAAASVERADLVRRLSLLPPRQRAVVVLRYYEGLSTAEIADLLGCTEGAVRTFHSRAMSALRMSIDRQNDLEAIR